MRERRQSLGGAAAVVALAVAGLVATGPLPGPTPVAAAAPVVGPLKAFPGAEGFGTDTPGGRGGTVCQVTNLNDAGAGSLRACVAGSGPRIVIFTVSGTITLASRLEIVNPT